MAGTGADLKLQHDGSHGYIQNSTGNLRIDADTLQLRSSAGENYLYGVADGAVSLYHDAVNTFKTTGNGVNILGPEGGAVQLDFNADEGDDNNDKWKVYIPDGGGAFYIQSKSSGSWVSGLTIASGGGSVTATKFLGDGSALTGIGGDMDITSSLFV